MVDIKTIVELNDYVYSQSDKGNSSEFVIDSDQPYTPLLVPTTQNTKITSVLPTEGLNIPFTVKAGNIYFDAEYNDYMVKIDQDPGNVNGSFISSFMGKRVRLAQLRHNMIIDGGHVEIIDNDIYCESGLLCVDNVIKNFSGIRLQTNVRISSLDFGYGVMFAIFIPILSMDQKNGIIVPNFEIVDMMEYQVGDYSTLYSFIEQEYGVYYKNNEYIEIVRGQMLNQSFSSIYKNLYIDPTVRNPSLNYYT